MNALQRLIADYKADTGESYAKIAERGGLPTSTVHSLATVESRKQTPHPDTIAALAKGLRMPPSRVRSAAADAAGYPPDVPQEMNTEEGRLIVSAFHTLSEERKRELARRARFLLMEQQESDSE